MVDNHDDAALKKILRTLDFSNPALREQLLLKLQQRSHVLSDEDLDRISAAGDTNLANPDAKKGGSPLEPFDKGL